MRFAQGIRVRCDDPDGLLALLAEWDAGQATTDVMGYIGTRLLADRDEPGCYLILAEFAEVDGDLTPAAEAERNNQREETERWAHKLRGARRRRARLDPLRRAVPHRHHRQSAYRLRGIGNEPAIPRRSTRAPGPLRHPPSRRPPR